jgi:glycogen(starch) synthase
MVQSIAPERVSVLPLAARTIPARTESGDDAPLVTAIGRFTAQKGWDTLLALMQNIEARAIHCRYAIVGDGPLRETVWGRLRGIVAPERLALHRHLGHDDELPRLLAETAVFVQFSAYETFGLAALEAAAAGAVPVLAAAGALPEVFPAHSGAILIPPGATETAVEAVASLLLDPAARAARAAMLRQHAALFSWERHAQLLESFLKQQAHR